MLHRAARPPLVGAVLALSAVALAGCPLGRVPYRDRNGCDAAATRHVELSVRFGSASDLPPEMQPRMSRVIAGACRQYTYPWSEELRACFVAPALTRAEFDHCVAMFSPEQLEVMTYALNEDSKAAAEEARALDEEAQQRRDE